ncbi:MAG: beta-galactosidase trimerization domain-containing protein, partial [Ignavibacteriales bacterium]|nr:beta-galactosidase trimerization domain-containing protein [Ignavibacteriales bacterium]
EIRAKKAFARVKKGHRALGAIVRESFLVEGAEVLADFDDGAPAITRAAYGKGKAILIGTYLGLAYYRTGLEKNAEIIVGLLESCVDIVRPAVAGRGKVRVDMLKSGNGQAMVIVRNLEKMGIQTSIEIPGFENFSKLREEFTGEEIRLAKHRDGVRMKVKLSAGKVKVYRA